MAAEKRSGIYCIENISTNKKYIGQSVDIHTRWCHHRSELKNHTHFNDYLQKSWDKYGEDDFKFYVIEYCDICELDDKENYYIDLYNTTDRDFGYNLKTGGQDRNAVFSDELRERISEAVKQDYIDHPEKREHKRESALKYWSNQETKNKRSGKNASMYGKHHTEESKRKISEARKGTVSYRRNTTPVFCIELNKTFKDATEAGKELSLDGSAILKVCRNERKTCGGFHWAFEDLGK